MRSLNVSFADVSYCGFGGSVGEKSIWSIGGGSILLLTCSSDTSLAGTHL